jgi:hypothetical protein
VKELVLRNFAGILSDQLLERMVELSLCANDESPAGRHQRRADHDRVLAGMYSDIQGTAAEDRAVARGRFQLYSLYPLRMPAALASVGATK